MRASPCWESPSPSFSQRLSAVRKAPDGSDALEQNPCVGRIAVQTPANCINRRQSKQSNTPSHGGRPCLCAGPWLCCSGEAATFVSPLLCDAWYRRSEQRNAGGICESHVCGRVRVCVHACVLCVLSLCGHSLQLIVLSVFCSCPCSPKPLFPHPPDHSLSPSLLLLLCISPHPAPNCCVSTLASPLPLI